MNENKLGTEKIGKLLLQYSIPSIVATLASAMYNVVDRIFIGRGAGSLAISGISLTFPVFTILIAFGMLIGMGSGTLISIRLGQNKKDEAEKILGNAFFLFSTIGILLGLFGLLFLDDLLYLFGASEATIPYAREYMSIIMPFIVFNFMTYGMNGQVRSEGNPKIAMMTILIGAILNIILDPIFIFVLDMGVKGAAIATVISNIVSCSWILYHFTLSKKSILKIKLKKLRPDFKLIIPALSIGLAPFILQMTSSLVAVFMNNNLLKYGGDAAIGAMGIIQSIMMFIIMPIIGISQGAQPIIGFNFGARNFDRLKKTLFLAITAATILSILGSFISIVLPEQLVALFNKDDAELFKIGKNGLRLYMMMFSIVGFQIIGSNFFQSIGKPKLSIILTLTRQVFLFLPLLLIFPSFWGLNGLWLAAPVSDSLAAILCFYFLARELKKINKNFKLN